MRVLCNASSSGKIHWLPSGVESVHALPSGVFRGPESSADFSNSFKKVHRFETVLYFINGTLSILFAQEAVMTNKVHLHKSWKRASLLKYLLENS